MKTYNIYKVGSEKIGTIKSTCITKAVKAFIAELPKSRKATYKLCQMYPGSSRTSANVRLADNYTICDDYVVALARSR